MNFEKRVTEWIDRQKAEVVAFLQELVRIPSVTGEEGPIQQFIAGRLREMGLTVVAEGEGIAVAERNVDPVFRAR